MSFPALSRLILTLAFSGMYLNSSVTDEKMARRQRGRKCEWGHIGNKSNSGCAGSQNRVLAPILCLPNTKAQEGNFQQFSYTLQHFEGLKIFCILILLQNCIPSDCFQWLHPEAFKSTHYIFTKRIPWQKITFSPHMAGFMGCVYMCVCVLKNDRRVCRIISHMSVVRFLFTKGSWIYDLFLITNLWNRYYFLHVRKPRLRKDKQWVMIIHTNIYQWQSQAGCKCPRALCPSLQLR